MTRLAPVFVKMEFRSHVSGKEALDLIQTDRKPPWVQNPYI